MVWDGPVWVLRGVDCAQAATGRRTELAPGILAKWTPHGGRVYLARRPMPKPASRHIVESAARPLRRCKKEGNGRLGRGCASGDNQGPLSRAETPAASPRRR